ncbi:unnamed protein product [Menidia menidia]|uniref:WD repeat and HMG-box DNA-binding protein 1 n=1 Tax=Menidia menidia TaxID=238744 RepID=A0A8S4A5D6_9TELE|nr:unnamed protein product [Menidia menidia]
MFSTRRGRPGRAVGEAVWRRSFRWFVKMPCERKPMRYGHSEGHTEVCFDDSGKFIVTCGNDGDVRIWESLDDDDPKFITVGEKAHSLALKNGKLVTASSNNTVQIHTFPEGEPDGILTRFTTNATHVAFNRSGSRVAAGSSDFLVKVVEVADSSRQKTLRGHEAPVLSVAFDPRDDFLASASCDGSVVLWNIEEQTQAFSWPLLQKTSDVGGARSLCRLAFQPAAAQFLAVPVETKVHLYQRGSWDHVGTLSEDLLTQPINVVAWSPCGRLLAAGGVGGSLTVWDVDSKLCVERQKHEKGFTVCSLAWHPSGGQIAYTDTEGCLGLLDGLSGATCSSKQEPPKKVTKDYDDLFDDDDDEGKMDEGLSSPVRKPVAREEEEEEEEEDFPMPSTGRVRNRGAILDDENSMDTVSLHLGRGGLEDDGDADIAVATAAAPLAPLRPVYEGPMPTPPPNPPPPAPPPAPLTHRFLAWNSVGIVRGYNDEQDNAIDVEFHNTAVHHAMHLTNSLGHSMAALSQQAVLLGCPGSHGLASKLQCLHFSSWDTNKEWMVDLPEGEDAVALCLGQGWAAAATSALVLRLFSIGGVQRELFSLPGPVVCMAGHGEQLLIAYHRGVNPFAKEAASPVTPSLTPVGKVGRANPFKVSGSGRPSSSSGRRCRWGGAAARPGKSPVLKPLAPRTKTKTQSTLLTMAVSKKPQDGVELKQPEPPSPAEDAENQRPKTGFQLWLEENRKNIMADSPDLEETEVIKEAMSRFRTLTAEERLAWTDRAKRPGREEDVKKRKRAEGEAAEAAGKSPEKKKAADASSRLSAFAFQS